ncbi:MAG TPA: histidine kinase N-terminal 7TM domain-containing protein [Anaerolineales bacterium]|nr:histidine kinase N-terminal 7TM domain-containing protein [Anaerolineales bacterium]HNN13157.1 histidine kinase N-terminal 7TM domain-containing protein [Anaerolineales bacterium]
MSPPNITYSALLMIAGGGCILVAGIIFQTRRAVTGGPALMTLLCALAWWDITYSFFWADMPAPTEYFWLDITYVGVVVVPVALLVFTLQISNLSRWLRRPLKILLYTVPVVVLVTLFTDSYHGLFFGGKRTENSAFILDAGPVFWFNVIFSYALVMISTLILINAYRRSAGMYRRQIGVVLLGMGIPWVTSILFILGFNLLPGADTTPFSFTVEAIAFAYGLMQYRLLDVVPIARDVLVENMSDGVIVIDDQNRVVDMNAAAKRLFAIQHDTVGEPVRKVFAGLKPAEREALNVPDSHFDITVGEKQNIHLDVHVTGLMDRRGRSIGQLVLFHNITKLKNIQNELRYLAGHDPLTGTINRRYFMELAHKELLRARRYHRNLSLVLIDLDEFKKVNDTYGHQAGDQALLVLKDLCGQSIRTIDAFARLGGEEFALLLPETGQDAAYAIAERLRDSLARTTIKFGGHHFKITMSMGVTEYNLHKDDTIDSMISRADKALYQAKAGGRNKVLIWKPEGKENHHENNQRQHRSKTRTGK